MIKRIILLAVLIATPWIPNLHGEELGELAGVLKPQMIRVHHEHLYVVEGHKIYHYQLPSLKFLGLIGKEGEGPGEFRLDPSRTLIVSVIKEELRAESRNKLVVFSLDGSFLREERKSPSVLQTIPFQDKLLVHHIVYENENRAYFVLDLHDRNGLKLKELYRQKFFQFEQYLYPIADGLNFCVIGDLVWVEESPDGFKVECFNSQGQSVKTVNPQVKALPVTPLDRQEALNHYLKIPYLQRLKTEQGEAALKQYLSELTIVYPDHFPAIRHLKWDGHVFVIRTYQHNADEEVHWLMDEKGKLLGQVDLPRPQEIDFLVAMQGDKHYYEVHQGFYYYLRTDDTDEDNERWILHRRQMSPHPAKN